MTIAMPDSITVANLPPGYPAYLGYVDGRWPTAGFLKQSFSNAHVLSLTVLGGRAVADGCDIETDNLSPASGAAWLHWRLSSGAHRPVAYASVASMTWVLTELAAVGVPREAVRLLTAHYGAGEHICGPLTCGQLHAGADGTQWTSSFPGMGGALIDMSVLADGFFGSVATPTPAPTANWEDSLLASIPVIKKGSVGQIVRNWQGLLMAHGYSLAPDGSDGQFGDLTDSQTRKFQEDKRVEGGADGEVGQHTWTAALTGGALWAKAA